MERKRDYIDKISIKVNGIDQYATGLSKKTTIDEIKYAMLSVSDPNFKLEEIDNYGVFEKWHENERLLEGKLKIHKIINFWKSVPGNQLSEVKFVIRKKKPPKLNLFNNTSNLENNEFNNSNLFDIKSINKKNNFNQELTSTNSDSDEDMYPVYNKKYINIKKSLIDLVKRQNELIGNQLETLSFNKKHSNEPESFYNFEIQNGSDEHKCEKLRNKIIESIQLELVQNDKIKYLNQSLKKLNHIIALKKEFIARLENELDSKDEVDKFTEIKIVCEPKISSQSNSQKNIDYPILSIQSTVSTASTVFTSVSSTSTNEQNHILSPRKKHSIKQNEMSDSWSNSEETNSIPLETLV